MPYLKTGKGLPFQISDEDCENVAGYVWNQIGHGYLATNIKADGRWGSVRLHRWLLNVTDPNVFVDHVNGDILDNRRENLRLATREQNNWNRRPRIGTSEFKGVSRMANKRARPWRANIRGRVVGQFATEKEAALAYDNAARQEYGEFAFLNFPAVVSDIKGTIEHTGDCLHCGKAFTGKHARRAYCSKLCCSLAWQKRKPKSAKMGIFG